MTDIDGVIKSSHRNPSCVAEAIRVDNLSAMETTATKTGVTTTVRGTKLRSVIASVDDYLLNLSVADEACRYGQGRKEAKAQAPGRNRGQDTQHKRR